VPRIYLSIKRSVYNVESAYVVVVCSHLRLSHPIPINIPNGSVILVVKTYSILLKIKMGYVHTSGSLRSVLRNSLMAAWRGVSFSGPLSPIIMKPED